MLTCLTSLTRRKSLTLHEQSADLQENDKEDLYGISTNTTINQNITPMFQMPFKPLDWMMNDNNYVRHEGQEQEVMNKSSQDIENPAIEIDCRQGDQGEMLENLHMTANERDHLQPELYCVLTRQKVRQSTSWLQKERCYHSSAPLWHCHHLQHCQQELQMLILCICKKQCNNKIKPNF
jgi:hypothetical protein